MAKANEIIQEIAAKHFRIECFEERGRDSLDFHDLHILNIQRALQDAYDAGYRAGHDAGWRHGGEAAADRMAAHQKIISDFGQALLRRQEG